MMTEEQKQALIARCNYLIGGAPEIDVQLAEFALSALTQPAGPALRLPDAKPVDLADENWDDVSLAENIGFNRCLLEVKRLNAPHTAPIEPICATGGAEWVKVPREPTRQMMSQGHFAMAGTDRGKFRRIYQAMIAAAPQPE